MSFYPLIVLFYIVCMYVVVLILPTYWHVSGFRPLPRMFKFNHDNEAEQVSCCYLEEISEVLFTESERYV